MKHTVILLLMVLAFAACENPYDLVSESKVYSNNPFVSLSSEDAAIRMDVNQAANHTLQAGVFKDSLILSHALDHDLTVTLELVEAGTRGDLEQHFRFQNTVIIPAGTNFGTYLVTALNVPLSDISKYKLAIRIKEVDDAGVIAGMYGTKKENEERKKRFKTYSFQQ